MAPTATVLDHPRHPYTEGLDGGIAAAGHIAGRAAVADPRRPARPDRADTGCNFRPRCRVRDEWMRTAAALVREPVIRRGVTGWAKSVICLGASRTWLSPSDADGSQCRRRPLTPGRRACGAAFPLVDRVRRPFARVDAGVLAVDDVSISIRNGEIVGLVGESGCGKTTLGRLLLRLVPADAGTLQFDGTEIPDTPAATFRRRAQIVLQNPDTALNPRQTVGTILRRPLQHFGLERDAAEIERLLGIVRLPASYAARYPHQLSGGEKQRVGIARALATRPDFLVCDEAVSALDVSVQAAVLNLLLSLRDELGLSYLFISHDIGVIAHVADRVVVMYRGSVVEEGGVQQVLRPPYHPYTELLLSSVPIIGRHRGAVAAERSTQRPDTAPEGVGCKFAARCDRKAGSICDTVAPPWQDVESGHRIRCHIPADALRDVVPWQRGYALERVTSTIGE